MVLAPLTTPAHFTGRRSGPPVKGQAAPLSPTAASPRSRLRAWRGKSFSEDTTPSPGAVHRSIFSLDPKELAALFLEVPAQDAGEADGAQDAENNKEQHSEGVLPDLEMPWDQGWTNSCTASGDEETRYVEVDDAEPIKKPKESSGAVVPRGVNGEPPGMVNRQRIRVAAIGAAVGASLLSFIIFHTLNPKKKPDTAFHH